MNVIRRNSWYFFCKYLLRPLPDKIYHNVVGFIMHKRFGVKYHWMNISDPKTFSEKLQYLKTHPVVDNEIDLADKYNVRQFVVEKIGEEHLVPLIGDGVYDNVETIDWDALPNQFVLKLTKGSGYNIICNDKSKLDKKKTLETLRNWMNVNPYYMSREPQYLGKPRIICEKLLEYNITDYKFFCFNGQPMYIELYIDRQGNHKKVFYDMNWNKVPFTTANDVSEIEVDKPADFEYMKMLAAKLSEGMKFVRVDLYINQGKVYFGELTFHPAGGYTPITPREWEFKLGDLIDLN